MNNIALRESLFDKTVYYIPIPIINCNDLITSDTLLDYITGFSLN
jgi:hypothetical protein